MVTYAYVTAGSEATGDAGIQVDLETFHQLSACDMGILTRIVPVDPKNDFNHRSVPIAPELTHDQIETVLDIQDIDTVKIGMLGTPGTIDVVEGGLKNQEWKNVVLGPVLICKGGEPGAFTGEALRAKILPLATVATSNYLKTCTLAGMEKLEATEDTTETARRISAPDPKHVVAKDGVDLPGPSAVDLLWDGERATMFAEPKIGEYEIFGAGYTLAAAITAEFIEGAAIEDAAYVAKDMVTAAIKGRIPVRTTYDRVWQGAYRG